ncbi:uncharacterized protein LOC123562988 isoform X2 [Mercenaria mercenaria]|uniref:uncharacterized protein LOC123562988 isoform X2 n=1 Tax=Mercenaria mercenaria TaxID=6596 RepID=UPI00234F63CE|nr:uncharacterized protein LOC123562988 isoform X2 [Mercenaria mercenaria]
MAYLMLAFMIASLIRNASTESCKSSTTGKEFVFGILDFAGSCCHNNANIIALDITNVSPNYTRIRLQIPYFINDTYFDIPSGGKETITINSTIQRDGTFKDSRGIKITSEHDISVLVTNAYNNVYNFDTYNILPVAEIGNNYIISSYMSTLTGYGSVFLVVGNANNTNVTIANGTNVLRSVVLNPFDVFQYECDLCDPTGMNVISSENIYVVAGSTFTGIPFGSEEYIAAEMLPTSTWSYKYIVAPELPKSAFMLRILSESSFDVTISNLTRTYRFSVSTADQYFETEAVVVTAERPFSATQYGVNYDYDHTTGDPFMTVVPSVDQYINDYTFTVPHAYYGVKQYSAIIVPKLSIDGLVLDGSSVQSYNAKSIAVPSPFDNYTILTFPVNEGYHHFYHTSPSVTFGVFMYGHGGQGSSALSYGFYAGFNLKGICSTSELTSTTTSTTASTAVSTSTSTTTSTSTLTTTSTTDSTTISAGGLMCYSCDDLSDINLCDTVKQCSNNKVCFVARYFDGSQSKFKSGCLQGNTCENKRNDSRYSDDLCFECCHDDYCNNKGCGENGIPDRDRRGPICFDCQHVSSPEQCVKISPCDSHQMCHIEEYKWFDHSHFKLGCGHGLCYPVRRMGSHAFKRETPVCHSCCSDDYCNRNCTTSFQGQTGSVIVG